LKIILIGSSGQVGYELQKVLNKDFKLILSNDLGKNSIDLSNPATISKAIEITNPDLIINAAAYTEVDNAEKNIDLSYMINSESPGVMAKEALGLDIPLIHYSSDYIFDGTEKEPKSETNKVNPISIYGKTKLQGEINIINSGCKHIIFRTSWVFSKRRKNFMKTILELAKEKKTLSIISDQIGTPTSANLIASTTSKMISKIKYDSAFFGIYNCVASGYTSWFDFARYIISWANKNNIPLILNDSDIIPIKTSEYKTLASRPLDSRLSNKKIEETLDIKMPDWEICANQVLEEIYGK
jgi:dTDP-4-dehydrorhamnose reductase